MALEDIYYGRGFNFPLELTNGRVELKRYDELIPEAIKDIIGYPYGVKFFTQTYGSKFYLLLEEPNDNVTITVGRQRIIEALNQWEPRINILSINAVKEGIGKLSFTIRYQIKLTGSISSITIPFNNQNP